MKSRPTATPWLVSAFLAGLLVAWMVTPPRPAPAPWPPVPSPHDERPILAGVVRLAKTLGWFLVFAEPAPLEQRAAIIEHQEPREPDPPAEAGGDGYAILRNAKGW